MKYFICLITINILFLNSLFSQTASNIRLIQGENHILIYYDFEKIKGYNKYIVSIDFSLDEGKTYKPVKTATGDIGKGVLSGENRTVNWNVLDDIQGIIGQVSIKIIITGQEVSYTNSGFTLGYQFTFSPSEFSLINNNGIQLRWQHLFGNNDYGEKVIGVYLCPKIFSINLKYIDKRWAITGGFSACRSNKFGMYLGGGIANERTESFSSYSGIFEGGLYFCIYKRLSFDLSIGVDSRDPTFLLNLGLGYSF